MSEKNSLWKNIRKKAEQNRRTGDKPKEPTKEMLRQEANIKAKKYAEGGPTGDDEDPFKSKLNQGQTIGKTSQDWLANWVQNPEFANRLNQNFPAPASDLEKKIYGNKEARERASAANLKTINKRIPDVISDIYDTNFLYNTNPESNTGLLNTYRSRLGDPKSIRDFDKNMSTNPQGFTDQDGRIVITNEANTQYGPQSVGVHELTHKVSEGDKTLDKLFRGKFQTPSPDKIDANYKKDEMYPFLMQMRFDNKFQPGEEITPERLKQIRESGPNNHLFRYYNDDEISKYLNTLASNQTQAPMQYAAKGGYMYAEGGDDKDGTKVLNRDGLLIAPTLPEFEVIEERTPLQKIYDEEFQKRLNADKAFQEKWYSGQEYDPTNMERRAAMAANDSVSKYIIYQRNKEGKTRNSYANRQEFLKALTDEEKKYIGQSNLAGYLEPDAGSRFRAAWNNINHLGQGFLNTDPDLTQEEANNISRWDAFAPLGVPLNTLRATLTGDNIGEAIKGETPRPWMSADEQPLASGMELTVPYLNMVGDVGMDPFNFSGMGIGEGLGKMVNPFNKFKLGKNKKLLPNEPTSNFGQQPSNMDLEELRRVYHNSERFLQREERRFLNKHGHGLRENYVTNPVSNQLPPPPSEIQFMPDGTTRTIYNQQPITDYDPLYSLDLLQQDHVNIIQGNPPVNYPNLTRQANEIAQLPLLRQRRAQQAQQLQQVQQANKPTIRNKSGLTKEEALSKASAKDKDVVSKMSETEFENTVLKPNGEVVAYKPGTDVDQMTYDLTAQQLKLKETVPLSNKEYVDEFNSRLDLLNDIIAKRNKSGVEYRVTGLDENGRLTFYTPPGQAGVSEGKSTWSVGINPGQWRGDVEDIANTEYFRSIPGLEMRNTTSGVFADDVARKGSGAYESINEYLKTLDLGRVKPGFNSQTNYSRGAWENFIKSGRGVGFYANPSTVYGTMRSLFPYAIPTAIGAGALQQSQQKAQGGYTNPYMYYAGGPMYYPEGGIDRRKRINRTLKNIGAGAYGLLEGTVDTAFGWIPGVDQVTDLGYQALQQAGNSSEEEIRKQNAIRGGGAIVGATGTAILTGGATTPYAIAEGAEGAGDIVSNTTKSKAGKTIGTGLETAGAVAGMIYGSTSSAKNATKAFKTTSKLGQSKIGSYIAGMPIKAPVSNTIQKPIQTTGENLSVVQDPFAAQQTIDLQPSNNFTAGTMESTIPNVPTYAPQFNPQKNKSTLLEKYINASEYIKPQFSSTTTPNLTPEQSDFNKLPEQQQAYTPQQFNQGTYYPINVPTFNNSNITPPDYNFGWEPNTAALGGFINNNSVNLQNTMRYKDYRKKYKQGGMYRIPEEAGTHDENAYGGVAFGGDQNFNSVNTQLPMAEGGEYIVPLADGNQYVISANKNGKLNDGGLSKKLHRELERKKSPLRSNERADIDFKHSREQLVNKYIQQNEMELAQSEMQNQQDLAMKEAALQYAAAGGKVNKDIERIVNDAYTDAVRVAEEDAMFAYGGLINPKDYGMPDSYAKGGIHIKESKKGTFTKAAKKRGKSVQEFARQVLANKDKYSAAMVKKANFAKNAAGWKHAEGGPMVSNVPQPFNGPSAQNRGGMMMANGGMMLQDDNMSKQVAAALQQGADPKQLLQQLIKSGMDPQQAQAMLQAIMGKMQASQLETPMMAYGGKILYSPGGPTSDFNHMKNMLLNKTYRDSYNLAKDYNSINPKDYPNVFKNVGETTVGESGEWDGFYPLEEKDAIKYQGYDPTKVNQSANTNLPVGNEDIFGNDKLGKGLAIGQAAIPLIEAGYHLFNKPKYLTAPKITPATVSYAAAREGDERQSYVKYNKYVDAVRGMNQPGMRGQILEGLRNSQWDLAGRKNKSFEDEQNQNALARAQAEALTKKYQYDTDISNYEIDQNRISNIFGSLNNAATMGMQGYSDIKQNEYNRMRALSTQSENVVPVNVNGRIYQATKGPDGYYFNGKKIAEFGV
jgi:hypothetical protein